MRVCVFICGRNVLLLFYAYTRVHLSACIHNHFTVRQMPCNCVHALCRYTFTCSHSRVKVHWSRPRCTIVARTRGSRMAGASSNSSCYSCRVRVCNNAIITGDSHYTTRIIYELQARIYKKNMLCEPRWHRKVRRLASLSDYTAS